MCIFTFLCKENTEIRELPKMTSDFRLSKGVQEKTPIIGHYRVKIVGYGKQVGRSKIAEKRRTSYMDVPKGYMCGEESRDVIIDKTNNIEVLPKC